MSMNCSARNIDNRLYNRHRYFYSRNLDKPCVSYLDISNEKHQQFYKKMLGDRTLIYMNEYQNCYTDEKIVFKEFL